MVDDVVILPVVRRKRRRGVRRRELPAVRPAEVIDLNAFRYERERALVERRSSRSLLPDLELALRDCGADIVP